MEFWDELYIGKSIADIQPIVCLLNNGEAPSGVFCACKKDDGRFLYEIMSSNELLKSRNNEHYTVYGLAAGKREAFEVLRYIVEDRHEY